MIENNKTNQESNKKDNEQKIANETLNKKKEDNLARVYLKSVKIKN